MSEHDVIVVGGGPVGLAAACEIAQRGHRVCVIERHTFEHDATSSTGETRQFRVQHETPELTQLALDAIPLWEDLSGDDAGGGPSTLLHPAPCLWFGDPAARGSTGRIDAVTDVMRSMGLPFESVDADDLQQRYPFAALPGSWCGFSQPSGAVIDVRGTLRVLHERARRDDRIELRAGTEVVGICTGDDRLGVTARNASGGATISADKLVLAPGAHLNQVLSLLGLRVDVTLWRMPSAWFRILDQDADWPMWVGFADPTEDDPAQYYGFPEMPFARPGYVRIAGNFPAAIVDRMIDGDLEPETEATALIAAFVRRHMPGLDPTPEFASSCTAGLITSPDDPYHVTHEMIIDFLPNTERRSRDIVVCSTGWMFKFIPLLGRLCADLACDGRSEYPIEHLRLTENVVTRESDS